MDEKLTGTNQGGHAGGNTIGPYPIPDAPNASDSPAPVAAAAARRRTRRFIPDASTAEGSTEGTRPARATAAAETMDHDETHAAQEVAKPPRATRQSKKDVAKRQVSLLLDTANMMASTIVAPAAAMRVYEREMIELPLHAYAERHAATVDRVAEVAAPLVCCMGLALWIKRVLALAGTPVAIPAFRRPRPTPENVTPITAHESQRTAHADTAPVAVATDLPQHTGPRVASIDQLRTLTELQK